MRKNLLRFALKYLFIPALILLSWGLSELLPTQAAALGSGPPRDIHLCDGTVLPGVVIRSGLEGETLFTGPRGQGDEKQFRVIASRYCGYWYEDKE